MTNEVPATGETGAGLGYYYVEAHVTFSSTSNRSVHIVSAKKYVNEADLSRRLSKWAVKLGQFNIKFLSKATIKGQVMANFVAKFSP